MKITKFGHACLLVETASSRLLIDPGEWSKGFEDLRDIDAVLITHSHPDHLVPDNVATILAHNQQSVVYADSGSAKVLADDGRVSCGAVKAGDTFEVAGTQVSVTGGHHAQIHPELAMIPNVAYDFDGFYYPGDSFTLPGHAVRVLALPLSAPWSKVSETIDFARKVPAEVVVPVHDAFLSKPELYETIISRLAGDNFNLKHLEAGRSYEF